MTRCDPRPTKGAVGVATLVGVAGLLLLGCSGTTTTAATTTATTTGAGPAGVSSVLGDGTDPPTNAFRRVLTTSGAARELEGLDGITVFAPSNLAMEELAPAERTRLATDRAAARAFVDRYTVARRLARDDLVAPTGPVTARDGSPIVARVTSIYALPGGPGAPGSALRVNGAPIGRADVAVRNGWVHVVNSLFNEP